MEQSGVGEKKRGRRPAPYDCDLGMTNLEALRESEEWDLRVCDLGGDGLLRVWEATGC
ncbi:hypothetical protein FH972_017794 [Carpinus fangiana]|uniref:Uncharacterized protein n=1 Tax=Carpinus fangiana TaxID=176857 RepID=A0A5N6RM18_9ROSI|nr:hypothetical protein FH972_017794 [Carpinus fangiana]